MSQSVFEHITAAISSITTSTLNVTLQHYRDDKTPLTFDKVYQILDDYAGGTGSASGLQWGATYPDEVSDALMSFPTSSSSSSTEQQRIEALLTHIEQRLPASVSIKAMVASSSLKRIFGYTKLRLVPSADWSRASDEVHTAMCNQTGSFEAIPRLVLEEIYSYLKPKVIAHGPLPELPGMAYCSRRFFNMAIGHKGMLTVLLGAVVRGEKSRVEAIIKTYPELLLQKGKATSYAGKIFHHHTALQIALCEGDVDITKNYHGLAEMLIEAMQSLEDGDAAIQTQIDEIFPEGAKAHLEAQQPYDFTSLIKIICDSAPTDVDAALALMSTGSELDTALQTFRADFTAVARGELVYNPQHLLQAFQEYDDNFDRFNNDDQRDLCWRQVVGYVQRSLPACDAQAFAQGLYFIIEKNESGHRSMEFQHGRGLLFPVGSVFGGLGFNFGSLVLGGAGRGLWVDSSSRRALSPENYVKQKSINWSACASTSSLRATTQLMK